ncbi:hypothetical protein N0V90_006997 [Kalmusia sp. IMI 367209]|nr:hypothetical protein N0V90_006997 [Kalmusia sp. IMI 367209]
MILMGDRGISDGYRHMHGYSGHTFKLINKAGEWVYAQLHMRSKQGFKFLTQADAASKSPDYAGKDLFDAIERGEYPGWDLLVQAMTPKQAEEAWEKQGINVLDLTHIWPQGQFPFRKVGEFFLNENVKNYFGETEQIAFAPSHLIAGIEPSADPVLQSRLFSYPDYQRYRLGVNYPQLPINSTSCPYAIGNFQRDGHMAILNQGSRPAYLSSIEPISFRPRAINIDKTHASFIGQAITFLSEMRQEDFNAPRTLWEKVFDDGAKERFVDNVSGHMANCSNTEVIKRQIGIFREVSEDLASRLEKATGIEGYREISALSLNGRHNGLVKDTKLRVANGMVGYTGASSKSNRGPAKETHAEVSKD